LPSISWSTSWSGWFQIHTQYAFGNSIFFHSNLCSLTVSKSMIFLIWSTSVKCFMCITIYHFHIKCFTCKNIWNLHAVRA
jgi:hypothetical protein